MPVGAEAESVFKKASCGGAVMNDEASVDEASGDGIGSLSCSARETKPLQARTKARSISLNKLDPMAFRILDHETLES